MCYVKYASPPQTRYITYLVFDIVFAMAGGGFDVIYSKMDEFMPKIQDAFGDNLEALRVVPLPLPQLHTIRLDIGDTANKAPEPQAPTMLEVYEILEALATPLPALGSTSPVLPTTEDVEATSGIRSMDDEEQGGIPLKESNLASQITQASGSLAPISNFPLDPGPDFRRFGAEGQESPLMPVSPSKTSAQREGGDSVVGTRVNGDEGAHGPRIPGILKRKFVETPAERSENFFHSDRPMSAEASSANIQKRGRLEADDGAIQVPMELDSNSHTEMPTVVPQLAKEPRTVTFACSDSDFSVSGAGPDDVVKIDDSAEGASVVEGSEIPSVLEDFATMNLEFPTLIDPVFLRKPLPEKKSTLKVRLCL